MFKSLPFATAARLLLVTLALVAVANISEAARNPFGEEDLGPNRSERSSYLAGGACMSPYHSSVSAKMAPNNARKKQVYQIVLGQVKANKLGTVMPAEFRERCSGLSTEQMEIVWAEALTQLAYVESGFRSGTAGDGGKSKGLFQMSANTSALGRSCFGKNGGPTNDTANARCAVMKWKDMLAKNSSIYQGHRPGKANARTRYWGPFTPGQCKKPQKGPSVMLAAHRKCQQFLRENTSGRRVAAFEAQD